MFARPTSEICTVLPRYSLWFSLKNKNQLVPFLFKNFISCLSFWDEEMGMAGWAIFLAFPTLNDHAFCVWRQSKHCYLLISYLEGESRGALGLKFHWDIFYDLKQHQGTENLLGCGTKGNTFSVCKMQARLFICKYLSRAYYFPSSIVYAGYTVP